MGAMSSARARTAQLRWRAWAILTLMALMGAAAGCPSEDECLGGSAINAKRYEQCQALCDEGNQDACDQRSELEGELSTLCSRRSNKPACRALCHGRLHSPAACDKLRTLP